MADSVIQLPIPLIFNVHMCYVSTRLSSRTVPSREGPGAGWDRTGPRDLEGPVVLPGQDLETLKVPGPLKKVPGPHGPFFLPQYDQNLQILHFGLYS